MPSSTQGVAFLSICYGTKSVVLLVGYSRHVLASNYYNQIPSNVVMRRDGQMLTKKLLTNSLIRGVTLFQKV